MHFSTLVLCIAAVGIAPLVNAAPLALSHAASGLNLPRFDVALAFATLIRPRYLEESQALERDLEIRDTENDCYDSRGNRYTCGNSNGNNKNMCTDAFNNRYTCGDNSENYCYNTSGNQCSCNAADFDIERTNNAKKDARRRKQLQAQVGQGNNLCTDAFNNRYECGDNSENYCYNTSGFQCSCNAADFDAERTNNARKDAKRRKQAKNGGNNKGNDDDDDADRTQKQKEADEREKQRAQDQEDREKQRAQEQKDREKQREKEEKQRQEEEKKKNKDN